jgi:hypothetical protein
VCSRQPGKLRFCLFHTTLFKAVANVPTGFLLPSVQWISGSVVEGAPTEEPRPDASNARSQRSGPRAIGVSRAFACVLNTRGCPQAFYTAPVIHPVRVHKYPWQEVNAVWGRYPTACTMCVEKKLRVCWGLARRQSSISCLRVEKLVSAVVRSFHPAG